jgi:hypothetical protein
MFSVNMDTTVTPTTLDTKRCESEYEICILGFIHSNNPFSLATVTRRVSPHHGSDAP